MVSPSGHHLSGPAAGRAGPATPPAASAAGARGGSPPSWRRVDAIARTAGIGLLETRTTLSGSRGGYRREDVRRLGDP